MILNDDKRCGTMWNSEGLWVTLAQKGNGMVMGQNHNFYGNLERNFANVSDRYH
jgi:hypothetical protein